MRADRVDLHLHTTCSDGHRTPSELIALCRQQNVTVAAVTDHDTLDGIAAAQAAGVREGVRVIPGVEVSVEHAGQDLHILAYFPRLDDGPFLAMLETVRVGRQRRIERMADRLRLLGIPLTPEEVREHAGPTDAVGRVHVAERLEARGWIGQYRDAFRYYIGALGPAYRAKATLPVEGCLERICAAGGVPVLAHPGAYRLDGLLELMVPAGLAGLEVMHPLHSRSQIREFTELAARWNLVATGGSDFHGDREDEALPGSFELGLEVVKNLEARRI